jgi:hypothetical protein
MLVTGQDETSQVDSLLLHPGSRALFRFWEASRGEDAAVPRSRLDLRRIPDLVPFLAIVERDPKGRGLRWRLAGTKVCNLYRREVTGGSVLAHWDSFEADVVARFLGSVIDALQPCLLRFRILTDLNQTIGAELIGLPLEAAGGGAIQVFAGLFPFRDTVALAYRGIAGIELSGARGIWTEPLPGDRLVRRLDADRQPFRPFEVIAGGRTR